MAWIAAVLGVFLFYKFVERPHKIIFFKLVGSLLILVVVVAGAYFLHVRKQDHEAVQRSAERAKGVSVEYENRSPKIDKKVMEEVALEVWNSENVQILVQSHFPKLSDNEQKTLRDSIVGHYLAQQPKRIVGRDSWEEIQGKDIDDYLRGGQAGWRVRSKEVKKFIEYMPYNKRLFEAQPFQYAMMVAQEILTLRVYQDLASLIKNNLTESELATFDHFQIVWEFCENSIREKLDENTNLESTLTFSICNNRAVPMKSCSFFMSGNKRARSTKFAIDRADYGAKSRFESDIVLPPNTCSPVGWTSKYRYFWDYEITEASGVWEDDALVN